MSQEAEGQQATTPVREISVAALATREPSDSLVRPAASLAQIQDAFNAYQQLSRGLLTDDDYQQIGRKKHRKRSAWRKLAVAFGVSFDIQEREITRDATGRIQRAEFVVRAIAPNGRYADGWGNCDVYERCCPPGCTSNRHDTHCAGFEGYQAHTDAWTHFSHAEHDLAATAETRAKNRAAADLFGMGEVSAEEIVGMGGGQESQVAPKGAESSMNSSRPAAPSPRQMKPATGPQLGAIAKIASKLGWSDERKHAEMSKLVGRQIRSGKELTTSEASKAIETWSDLKPEPKEAEPEKQSEPEPIVRCDFVSEDGQRCVLVEKHWIEHAFDPAAEHSVVGDV